MAEGYTFRVEPAVRDGVEVAWDVVAENDRFIVRFGFYPHRAAAEGLAAVLRMCTVEVQTKWVAFQVIADGVNPQVKTQGG